MAHSEPCLAPLDYLCSRIADGHRPRWLDLCCGTGRALIQAAEACADIDIVGVDLIDLGWPVVTPAHLRLVASSLHSWRPDGDFDLITCVHGLHYVGDKLDVIARAASWLAADGCFVANLDIANLRDADGELMGRQMTRLIREAGMAYDTRRHRLTCEGRRVVRWPLAYLGANDAAGPNYTGQAAVNAHYRWARSITKGAS